MTFCKLIYRDFRVGLFRWPYLITFFIAGIPLLEYVQTLRAYELSGSLGDCLIYLFRGVNVLALPAGNKQKLDIPVFWILLIIVCLFLHIGYFLGDMTASGQQILLRSQSRKNWLLSKCIWSIAGGILYYLLILLSAVIFCLITNQYLKVSMTESVSEIVLNMNTAPPTQVLFTVVLKPILAFVAMNLLQMMLQVLSRPIAGFLICLILILSSLYCPVMCFPTSGAIALRNIYLPMDSFTAWVPVISSLVTGTASIFILVWRFSNMDLLPVEGN